MHRVVQMNSTGYKATTISSHKSNIETELSNYSTYEYQVNDGSDMDDNPTLGVNADFDSATGANNFHNWLKNYIQNNSADFENARTRVHDCYHAAGENKPCELGDVWRLS